MSRFLLLLPMLFLLACEEETQERGDSEPPPVQKEEPASAPEPAAVSHDTLLLELLETTGNLGAVLVGVTDIESANRAADRIYAMANQLDRLANRLTEMEAPSRETRIRYSERIREADERMKQAMGQEVARKMQEMGPEAAAIIRVAVEDFFARMKASGPEFDRHFKTESS